jgi:hypothetical protein
MGESRYIGVRFFIVTTHQIILASNTPVKYFHLWKFPRLRVATNSSHPNALVQMYGSSIGGKGKLKDKM